MGKLVEGFTEHADDVFIGEINFESGQNMLGETFGMDVRAFQIAFVQEARKVCREMDIMLEYERTDTGIVFGLERQADYAPFLQKVEAQVFERAEHYAKSHTMVDGMPAREAQIVIDELRKAGHTGHIDLEDKIRVATTPAIGNTLENG